MVLVKKNLSLVYSCQEKAEEMYDNVQRLWEKEEDQDIKKLLEDSKVKLSEITRSKSKRSLLPFVGTIMRDLFGVARNEDLEKEKERLDKIEKWANEYGHVINQIIENVNQKERALDVISKELNQLESKIEISLTNLERKIKVQNIVNEININVNGIKDLIESLRRAKLGEVDVNMISLAELKQVIDFSVSEFGFRPLEIDIYSYYSLLTSKIVNDICYILLPFNNEEILSVTKIIPFPMIIEDKVVKLMEDETIILQNKNHLVSVWKSSMIHEKCLKMHEKNYICKYENFYLQSIEKNKCMKFLVQGGIDYCQYQYVDLEFAVEFLKDIYVFAKERIVAEISCKGIVKKLNVYNVKMLPKNCKIKIPNWFYYEPTLFQSINVNDTNTLLNIDYNVNVKGFKIEHHQIKMQTLIPFESPVFMYYRHSVVPWMTMLYIPFIMIMTSIVFCAIRMMVIRKLAVLNEMLQNHFDKGKK